MDKLALYSVLAIWGSIALVFILGVITVTVIGIILLRRKKTAAGIFLTVAGSLGIMSTLALAGLIWYAISSVGRYEEYKHEEFNPDTYAGKLGNITLPYKGESYLNERDDKKKQETRYSSKDGKFRIPAGPHDFGYYEICNSDSDGNKWEAYSWKIAGLAKHSVIPEGAKLEINAGPPFIVKISMKESFDGSVSFSLDCKDKEGNEFSLSPARGRDLGAPRFEVLSASGETLWTGDFKYG
mgnify:CR=1 FL=1